MRPFSEQEKNIIKSLLKSDQKVFTLMDFIKFNWPAGRFEISTFQQVVRIHLEDDTQLTRVMHHLLEALSLIKDLEDNGYLNSWDAFPMEDNTEQCGEKSDHQKALFLPDLSVASELLGYGNKKFTPGVALAALDKRGFKSVAALRHRQVIQTLIGGFSVLVVIGFMTILTNYHMIEKGIRVNLNELQNENAQVLRNQKLNQQIIDSLHRQSKQLMVLTNQISGNTQNINKIEEGVERQNLRIRQLRYHNRQLLELSVENHEILKKTDSMLNKITLN